MNKKGRHTEKWKCFLNSMLYLESRVIVRGCVLFTKTMRDISGGFPGSPQGQEEIFGCHGACSFSTSVDISGV